MGFPMTEPRRRELLDVLASSSPAEIALVRLATPIVSAFRLKHGQFAFRRHTISLTNPSLKIALTLPRSPGDAGLSIISSSASTVEEASHDKELFYSFNVRRKQVKELLRLLIRDNPLYKAYTLNEDDSVWDELPDVDGGAIPSSIPFWEEGAALDATRPKAELAIPPPTLAAWLCAGEDDPAAYPIAAQCRSIWNERYDLANDMEALAEHILEARRGSLCSHMMPVSDVVSFMKTTGVFDRGGLSEHGIEAAGDLPDIHSQRQQRGRENGKPRPHKKGAAGSSCLRNRTG